jgi:hypothetical protein
LNATPSQPLSPAIDPNRDIPCLVLVINDLSKDHDWYMNSGDKNTVEKACRKLLEVTNDDHSNNIDLTSINKLNQYANLLVVLKVLNSPASGSIQNLKHLTNLEYLNLSNTNVEDDIEYLKDLINLKHLYLNNTIVCGDIANLTHLTNLTNLNLSEEKQWNLLDRYHIHGDINSLSELTTLKNLNLSELPRISGDIDSLSKLTNLDSLVLTNTKIYAGPEVQEAFLKKLNKQSAVTPLTERIRQLHERSPGTSSNAGEETEATGSQHVELPKLYLTVNLPHRRGGGPMRSSCKSTPNE